MEIAQKSISCLLHSIKMQLHTHLVLAVHDNTQILVVIANNENLSCGNLHLLFNLSSDLLINKLPVPKGKCSF
jgi:hypothetical protein